MSLSKIMSSRNHVKATSIVFYEPASEGLYLQVVFIYLFMVPNITTIVKHQTETCKCNIRLMFL